MIIVYYIIYRAMTKNINTNYKSNAITSKLHRAKKNYIGL